MINAIVSRISGPVVTGKGLGGAHMFDVVRIGEMGLVGEIIRLEGDTAQIQVYEDTTGIRPGEKLHEVLCPAESANETIEFKNYYLIKPSIDFIKGKTDIYKKNKKGERGKYVKSNFIYSSDTNKDFLSIKEIKKLS